MLHDHVVVQSYHVNISRCWSYDMLRNARSFYGGKTSHRTRGIIQALVQMTLELLEKHKTL